MTSGNGVRPAITERSTQPVTKLSEPVRIAITEAFRELAGEEVALTREDLHQWFLKRRNQK